MFTSGPRPQNPCPLGLQCDRRIESAESAWARRPLSVGRSKMDHFQMDSPAPPPPRPRNLLPGEDDPTSERLGGTSQDTAVASRAPLGGAIVD